FDSIPLAAVNRDRSPPSGRIARDNFCRDQLEDRALSIIEGVTQTIHFMLDIAQALVGRPQLPILHLKCSILVLQLIERLQPGADGCDLFFQPCAASQEWRHQLIDASLELLSSGWAEAKKISQDGAKNQQGDDV